MSYSKINLSDVIGRQEKIVLELGGGPRYRPGRINIDIVDLPETDIVADLEQGLRSSNYFAQSL